MSTTDDPRELLAAERELVRADLLVAAQLARLREESYAGSLPAVQEWVRRAEAVHGAPGGAGGWLGRLRRAVARHRALAAAGLGALALGAACMPVTRVRTVGFVIAGRIAQPPREATRALLTVPGVEPGQASALGEVAITDARGRREVVAYVGSGVATVDGERVVTPTSRFAVVLADGDAARARRVAAALRALPGTDAVLARPLQDTVRARAYEVALQAMELEAATPLDAATVQRLAAAELAGLALRGVTVRVETGADGARRVTLRVEGDSLTPEEERRVAEFWRRVQGR